MYVVHVEDGHRLRRDMYKTYPSQPVLGDDPGYSAHQNYTSHFQFVDLRPRQIPSQQKSQLLLPTPEKSDVSSLDAQFDSAK